MPQTGRQRLADYRKRSRLKQYELADLLGMHYTTMSQVLAGKRRPGLDTALRIEQLTGVPVESWLVAELSDADRGRGKSQRQQLGREKSVA